MSLANEWVLMDKILIVDLLNQIYRANIVFGRTDHSLNLATYNCKCGQPWNMETEACDLDFLIIYNFFKNLRPLVEKFAPDKCFFVGEGYPKFRYELFPEYKASRAERNKSKPSTKNKILKAQKIILELAKMLGITYAVSSSYEADDVIGSLCENLQSEDITILSGDSDLTQILQQGYANCQLYNPIKKEFVKAPEQNYIQMKSLLGDSSDDLPRLLSEKKALKILSDPKLFEAWYSETENAANFDMNYKLIKLAEVPPEEIEIIDGHKDYDSLKKRFEEMRFNSMINDFAWKKFTQTFDVIKF